MYLAIDTSTGMIGTALTEDGHLVAEDTWRCRENHSVELLPHVAGLLREAGISPRQITGVIAARGPGGFNGLRVGLGTAKGLAFGLNVPIAGISTLAAAAYQFGAAGLPVCAILPAGRSEVAWAIYRELEGEWRNIVPEIASSYADVLFYVNSPTIIAGEPGESVLAEIRCRAAELALIDEKPPKTRIHALAELGETRISRGQADDIAKLQPLYLRRPPITQPKSRAAGLRPCAPAVILDMDGVIVDSGLLHMTAWQETFKHQGIEFNQIDFQHTFSMANRDIVRYKLGEKAAAGLVESIGQAKEELFRTLVHKEGVQAIPGAALLISSLNQAGFPLAVASSAPRVNIELILERLDLQRCFQAVVSEEDVTRGKPDPQPFLVAMERLGALPEQTLVIEDAPAGIEAAHRGGLKAIGLTTSHQRSDMAAADQVAGSLAEITPETIVNIIKSN